MYKSYLKIAWRNLRKNRVFSIINIVGLALGIAAFGLILEYPQAKIHAFAEEHGFLDLARSNARPKVGEVVRVVPNHVCVVVNMVDRMIAVRGDRIVDVLPVAARGRLA